MPDRPPTHADATDVGRYAAVVHDRLRAAGLPTTASPATPPVRTHVDIVRVLLDALAADGRLTPPGWRVNEQWALLGGGPGEEVQVADRAAAEREAAALRLVDPRATAARRLVIAVDEVTDSEWTTNWVTPGDNQASTKDAPVAGRPIVELTPDRLIGIMRRAEAEGAASPHATNWREVAALRILETVRHHLCDRIAEVGAEQAALARARADAGLHDPAREHTVRARAHGRDRALVVELLGG